MHQLPFNSGDFSKDDKDYQRLEKAYLERIKGYERDELEQMAKMTVMVLSMHMQDFGDYLGEIAGDNGFLNQDGGQFFTPFSVARAMAIMNLENAHDILERKGIITISDPAVGGGACLMAAAKALYDQKIDPRSAAQFDAVDISRNAFNMAYIQLSAADLNAMVRHGNTISMEIWENRPTPQLRYFDRELKQYRAITQMKQLLTDPDSFFNSDMVEPIAQTITESTLDNQSTQESEPMESPAQQSLFGSQEFSSAQSGSKRRLKSDVVIPSAEQLDLFSEGNTQS